MIAHSTQNSSLKKKEENVGGRGPTMDKKEQCLRCSLLHVSFLIPFGKLA